MFNANSYENIIRTLADGFQDRYPSRLAPRMVGILFAPPHAHLAKDQIIPYFKHYHHRSGNSVDFFCVGYGAHLPPTEFPDLIKVGDADDPWGFSDEVFNNMRRNILQQTGWRYSGEVDLILVTASVTDDAPPVLDFSTMIVLDLALMIEERAILSVPRLFEDICGFCEANPFEASTSRFSNNRGVTELGALMLETIVDAFPKAGGAAWKRGKHFRVLKFKR
jgi:hypothetical protein